MTRDPFDAAVGPRRGGGDAELLADGDRGRQALQRLSATADRDYANRVLDAAHTAAPEHPNVLALRDHLAAQAVTATLASPPAWADSAAVASGYGPARTLVRLLSGTGVVTDPLLHLTADLEVTRCGVSLRARSVLTHRRGAWQASLASRCPDCAQFVDDHPECDEVSHGLLVGEPGEGLRQLLSEVATQALPVRGDSLTALDDTLAAVHRELLLTVFARAAADRETDDEFGVTFVDRQRLATLTDLPLREALAPHWAMALRAAADWADANPAAYTSDPDAFCELVVESLASALGGPLPDSAPFLEALHAGAR